MLNFLKHFVWFYRYLLTYLSSFSDEKNTVSFDFKFKFNFKNCDTLQKYVKVDLTIVLFL